MNDAKIEFKLTQNTERGNAICQELLKILPKVEKASPLNAAFAVV